MEGFENGLLVVPDGEVPGRTEKINLKNLYEMFRDTNSHGGLVSVQFICALGVFFGVNIEIIENTISELHQNLSYKTLSGAKDFEYNAIFDIITELSFQIKTSTLQNRK